MHALSPSLFLSLGSEYDKSGKGLSAITIDIIVGCYGMELGAIEWVQTVCQSMVQPKIHRATFA